MSINLEADRLNRGLSVASAADQIGVAASVLHRAERGTMRPRPAAMKAIADFYGYKVTDIWPVEERQTAA